MNKLDFNTSLFEAVGAPRLHHQLMPHRIDLELGFDAKIAQELSNIGHNVRCIVNFNMNKSLTLQFRLLI